MTLEVCMVLFARTAYCYCLRKTRNPRLFNHRAQRVETNCVYACVFVCVCLHVWVKLAHLMKESIPIQWVALSEPHLKFMKNDATLTCHLGWISLTILPSTIVYKILSHMHHIWPQRVSLISFPPSLPFSNFTPTTLASLLFLESTKLVPNLRACTCSSSAWNDLTDIDTVCPLTSLRSPLRNQFLRENLPLFPNKYLTALSFSIPLHWFTFLVSSYYSLKVYSHLLIWFLPVLECKLYEARTLL